MSKTRGLSSRNNSKVNVFNEIGKETLLKKTMQPKPLGLANEKNPGLEATPLPGKCMSKKTSTPGTVAGPNNTIGNNWLNIFGSSACKTSLSPIVFDGDGRTGFDENKKSLPSKKLSQVEVAKDDGQAKKVLARRRTSGMRRLFSVVEDKDEEVHCSNSTDRQLKVQLHRTPLKSINMGKENILNESHSNCLSEAYTKRREENTLIRNLRNDWTSSTLCESLLKTPQTPKDVPKKQPQVRVRKHLSTLFECTSAGENCTQKGKSKKSFDDESYSSSEEFEKDDAKGSCSLKRAPTWRSLHFKVGDSTNTSSSINQSGQSKHKTASTSVNIVQNNDASCKNNDCLEGKTGKPTSAQDANTQFDKYQGDVQFKLPRVKLKRLKFDLEHLRAPPKANSLVEKVSQVNCNSSFGLARKNSEHNERESFISDSTPSDVRLSKENNSSTPCNPEGAKQCIHKSQVNEETKPNLLSGVKLSKVRLRRFKIDSENIQSVPQIEQLIPESEELHEIQSVNDVSVRNHELKSVSPEPVIEGQNNIHSRRKMFEKNRFPRPRLRRLNLRSEKNLQVPQIENVGNSLCLSIIEELSATPEASQDPHATNQEPASNTENIFDEDVSALLEMDDNEIERPSSSPTYDAVDNNTSMGLNCTKTKFFTSRIYAPPLTSEPIAHPKNKSSANKKNDNDNIYDYFSQSSSEEMIPVDDIIEKMIKTGRAVVVKHNKRRRKPIQGTRRKREAGTKAKKDAAIKPKCLKTRNRPQTNQQAIPPKVDPIDCCESHHSDDIPAPSNDIHSKNDNPWQEQSSFSGLARSTMIRQANASVKVPNRKMITDRRKLLLMAKEIVGQSSTPVKPTADTINVNQLSPIYGNKSPWRATDDHYPKTFYFGRNNANLPSFSSDHIPSTQTENRPKSVSSFSSNDSDMENIAPVGVPDKSQLDARTIQRRGPSNRSPLKSINIIEVVNLPPLVFDNTAKESNQDKNRSTSNPMKSNASLNQIVQNETSQNKTVHEDSNASKVDLFGFEEIIADDDNSQEVSLNITAIPTKNDIKEKLHRLKRLKPEVPFKSTARPVITKDLYEEPKMKQKNLRHMLCSTMIEKPKSVEQDGFGEKQDAFFNDDCNGDLSNLFKDPDPETTFNQSDSRRTYSRLYKTRKRKVRNNFVMFMDSDASEEEEESILEIKPKKRHKNEPNTNAKELDKFANEFNEMCKEISQYQLIVE